jgi:hypothetical protein
MLLRATTELFIQSPGNDADAVRRFEDVALHLLPKVADADRAFVAESLADRTDAPGMVVRALAKDAIAIAAPLLCRSPALGSLDLLVVIAATGAEHHRLIAARPLLPPEVVRALRLGGDAEVARVLDEAASAMARETAMPRSALVSPVPAADAAASAEPPPRRAPNAPLTGRFDPWQYLELDRPARLRLVADLASRPPIRHYGGPASRLDRAFRSILGAAQIVGHARNGQKPDLVEAISGGLDLEPAFIYACLDDDTGEPLAVLLKALSLDSVQAQQVFLLATTTVGRDASVFFRLCDLYAGMEASVAETLVEWWREGGRRTAARHQPLFVDTDERDRPAAVEPLRERGAPAADRLAGGARA